MVGEKEVSEKGKTCADDGVSAGFLWKCYSFHKYTRHS